jgi:hypothetical protein
MIKWEKLNSLTNLKTRIKKIFMITINPSFQPFSWISSVAFIIQWVWLMQVKSWSGGQIIKAKKEWQMTSLIKYVMNLLKMYNLKSMIFINVWYQLRSFWLNIQNNPKFIKRSDFLILKKIERLQVSDAALNM